MVTEANNRRFANRVLAYILALAVSADYLHRQVMAVILGPLAAEFTLNDKEMSWLPASYALAFVLGSLFLTFTVDRFGQRRMLAASLFGLGLFSVVSAMLSSYPVMLLSRALMGFSAALLAPAAQSMIGQYIDGGAKVKAVGLLSAASPFGLILGFGLWGIISGKLGWQWAVVSSGVLTLILGLVVWKNCPIEETSHRGEYSIAIMGRNVLDIFWIKSFRYLSLAFACTSVGLTASVQLNPTILVRSYGMTLEQAGIYLALIFGILGVLSALLSGQLVTLFEHRFSRISFWVCIGATVTSAPLYAAAYLAHSVAQMLMLLAAATLFGFLCAPQLLLVIQRVVPGHLSALALGLTTACFTGFSMGISLPLVGWASDYLSADYGDAALRISMVVVPSIFYMIALWFYALAARHFPD